jgi:hypothetical protein
MEEARHEALEASRVYSAEIKRQVAEAVKAGQVVDVQKIRQEIDKATATNKAQMAELQAFMQQLRNCDAALQGCK